MFRAYVLKNVWMIDSKNLIYMFNKVKIYSRIESSSVVEAKLSISVAKDVAFHMTDWLNDLAAYV